MLQEALDHNMIKFVRLLIDYYHGQGMPHGGGAGKNSRYFMYLAKEELQNFIVAVAWLHDNTPFRFVAQQYQIPSDRSYFIRRVTKTAPGDYLVKFLVDLSEKLKNDGLEVLWTLGMPNIQILYTRKQDFKK